MNGTLDMDRIRFIANDPNSSPEARRGARAILAREGMGADPYRDMSLEAAATPIVTEPEVQPRSMRETMAARQGNTEPMTPAEIQAAFAASDAWLQLPEQQARRAAERAQMVSEITGMPVPEAGGPRTGSPQRMQMIDGVEVPVIEGPVGESMYRLGDIRAAQEAQREAMRLSQVREANRRDMEQYGYGTNEPTDDQLAARAAVTQERMGQAAGGRQEELRIRRLAESLGVTEAQAAAAYEAAIDRDNLSPQGLGRAMTVARRALLADPKSGAVDKRAAQKEYARGVITRRAQAQSNPQEYLGRKDVDDWQKMVMARRMVGSSGFTPIEMQSRQNEGLQRLGERFMQGGGGRPLDPAQAEMLRLQAQLQQSQLPVAQQAAMHVQDDEVHTSELAYADDYVSQMYSRPRGLFGTTSDFSVEEQQLTIDHLVNDLRYDQAKAQRIVDEVARRRNQQSWAGSSTRQNPVVENPTGGAL